MPDSGPLAAARFSLYRVRWYDKTGSKFTVRLPSAFMLPSDTKKRAA